MEFLAETIDRLHAERERVSHGFVAKFWGESDSGQYKSVNREFGSGRESEQLADDIELEYHRIFRRALIEAVTCPLIARKAGVLVEAE